MAHVVEAKILWQLCADKVTLVSTREVACIEWRADRRGKDESGFLPVLAGTLALELLTVPVGNERRHERGRKSKCATAAFRLRLLDDDLFANPLECLAHAELPHLKVDVLPPQPENFCLAHPQRQRD